MESATTYFTDEAGPLKVGNGLKVTVPFAFTVYVPSLATISSVSTQLAFAVKIVAHNFTEDVFSVAGEAAESFVTTENV